LSTDDRFEEIKRLLDSTIDEFQSLFQSAGGFENSRVGNGWNPNTIAPDIYYLQPKPAEEIAKIAESGKRSLFRNRLLTFLKPRENEINLVDKAKLRLVPFWRIRGYHECFYFRGNSYRIDLPEDVVAVEVEGRIRDLVGQDATDSQTLSGITRRLLGKPSLGSNRYFRLNEVTELAYMYRDGSLFLNAEGKEDLEAEAFFDGKVPLQKTTTGGLKEKFSEIEIAESIISKEELVRRLHLMVVKPPATFSKILSNRFQVTELSQYLMPIYHFTFEWKGHRKQLSLHGYTGGILQ